MKLSANEEYGLRCLVRIGYAGEGGSLTIPEISQAEGVSPAYAAKILRVLRKGGFVKAARGKEGGYTLARPAEKIVIGDGEIDITFSHLPTSEELCKNQQQLGQG